jgi:hypothetical protein
MSEKQNSDKISLNALDEVLSSIDASDKQDEPSIRAREKQGQPSIDEAIAELRAEGLEDKIEIARKLKEIYHFRTGEIVKKMRVSVAQLYGSGPGAEGKEKKGKEKEKTRDIDKAVLEQSETTILNALKNEIATRTILDLQESLRLGDNLRTHGIFKMASERGFRDVWDFIETCINFYETWHDLIIEKQIAGEIAPRVII